MGSRRQKVKPYRLVLAFFSEEKMARDNQRRDSRRDRNDRDTGRRGGRGRRDDSNYGGGGYENRDRKREVRPWAEEAVLTRGNVRLTITSNFFDGEKTHSFDLSRMLRDRPSRFFRAGDLGDLAAIADEAQQWLQDNAGADAQR